MYEDTKITKDEKIHNKINHPSHYTSHPAKCACGVGIECIQITEHMDFLIGNTVKYLWRAGLKDDNSKLQDMQKAKWYLERAIVKESANQP